MGRHGHKMMICILIARLKRLNDGLVAYVHTLGTGMESHIASCSVAICIIQFKRWLCEMLVLHSTELFYFIKYQ